MRQISGGLLLFVLMVNVNQSSIGDDKPKSDLKRAMILLNHSAAKEVAEVLSKHFKGEAEIEPAPESTGNMLLIRATPDILQEIERTVAELDKRPKTIDIDVVLFDVITGKEDMEAEKFLKSIGETDLNAKIGVVAEQLEQLTKKNKLGQVRHLELTGFENRKLSAQLGEEKPFKTGVNVNPMGKQIANIQYRSVGVLVRATPRVSPENQVVVDFDIQDSRMHTPEDGVQIGTGPASEFVMTAFTSKMTIPSGKVVLAKGTRSISKSGNSVVWILVSAKIRKE